MDKVAIVTGGSSGIGLCTAQSLLKQGCKVYELSRHESTFSGIEHIKADVSDPKMLSEAIHKIYEREGRIDILVCNAGYGISGAVEFTDLEDLRKLIDVNFFGVVHAVQATLPLMRKTGGRIVCVSSVAGALPIPFQTYYSVSKAATNAFVLALANEVKPFGISVCAVMPGDIKTNFVRQKNHFGDDIYSGRIARSVATMEKDEQNGMMPEAAGKFISHTALRRHVKPLYAIGIKYSLFVVLSRILPISLVTKIVGILYSR